MSVTTVSAAATVNRENARQADGKFGEQPHAEVAGNGQLNLTDTGFNRFSPSHFDPEALRPELEMVVDLREDADFRCLPDHSLFADEARERGANICTCCGQVLRYAAVYNSTEGFFVLGQDCAETLHVAQSLGRPMAQVRAKAAERAEAEKISFIREERLKEDPELAKALALRGQSDFLDDLYTKMGRYELTDLQRDAAIKAAERIIERDHEEAEWDSRPHQPVPEGKQTVVGKVAATRWDESRFGYQTTYVLKMLVVDDRGFKVWCSAPAALKKAVGDDEAAPMANRLRGRRVQFDATLERSENDELFGFGSRPSKAKLLSDES